jgi:NAD(P)H-hydrate epimerase
LTGELNWMMAEDFQNFPPRRGAAEHKGSHGHVSILAGSFGYHGAAVLATRGAQRAQPGLVTLSTQENVFTVAAAQLQAAMVNVRQPDAKIPEGIDAVLIGPGMAAPEMAEKLRQAVPKLWREAECPLVVDASALAHVPEGEIPAGRARVITPHPGEAARLLNIPTAKLQADRVGSLRALSKKFGGCRVVLKGYQTLAGRAEGNISVNSTGNPHLAQGGSGDLLAGFIAGLLAQPALRAEVGKTLAYAVWEHGAAADRLEARRGNWIVEDLAEEIGGGR